jgi:hypothetical protein
VARSRSGTRGRRGPRKPQRRDGGVGQAAVQVADPRERGAIELPGTITVKELAELLQVNAADVIRELIKSGIFATINQLIDRDTVVIVLSDGWDTGEPEVLSQEMLALKRRAARVIWLNPLLGNPSYEPLTRGMAAALLALTLLRPRWPRGHLHRCGHPGRR